MPRFEILGHDRINSGIFTSSALFVYHVVDFELKMFDYGDYNLA